MGQRVGKVDRELALHRDNWDAAPIYSAQSLYGVILEHRVLLSTGTVGVPKKNTNKNLGVPNKK